MAISKILSMINHRTILDVPIVTITGKAATDTR